MAKTETETEKKPNRVWIELDPKGTHEENHERARLASIMLKRLGVDYHKPVFWFEKEFRYCFTVSEGGCYVEATDHGHWYNLDYFGREDEK